MSAAVVFVAELAVTRLFFSEPVQQDFDSAGESANLQSDRLPDESNLLIVADDRSSVTRSRLSPRMSHTNLRAVRALSKFERR